jgi:hypothetical protein
MPARASRLRLRRADLEFHVHFERPEVRIVRAAIHIVVSALVVLDHHRGHQDLHILSGGVGDLDITFHFRLGVGVLDAELCLKHSPSFWFDPKRSGGIQRFPFAACNERPAG